MNSFAALITGLLFTSFPQAADRPCPRQTADEPIIYMNDFKWGQTLPEMEENFKKQYSSGKRLKGRAFFDAKVGTYFLDSDTAGLVKIDAAFIKAITKHIEISLERRYADFVFFPDMGHSHLYIPDRDWPEIEKITSGKNAIYEAMFKLRSLKILYHTAEQLKVKEGERNAGDFPQDPILLWRYHSRNVVGDNQLGENVYPLFNFEEKSAYNTVREIAGHHLFSAGFALGATKNGCFSYKKNGETFYFDLSLEDPPYNGSTGDDAF